MSIYYLHYKPRLKRIVTSFFLSVSFFVYSSFISVQAQAPTITSFSPASVCQGNAIKISGTNFTGATIVKLGSSNATSFTVNNATTITAIAGAPTIGNISVTTSKGSASSSASLTILQSPIPVLTDLGNPDGLDAAFTNCDGNSTYTLTVVNGSTSAGGSCIYGIDWGDGSSKFTQTDWASGAQTSHTYNAQGYFNIVLTITPTDGCAKSVSYKFYNGTNPLASLTTTMSTTGLCIPASIEFQIGNWFNNSAGTTYQLDFGDGTPDTTLQHPLNLSNTVQLVSHIYRTSSCPNVDFTATLKAINGCFITTYTLDQIIIRQKPIADFNSDISACLNTPICFTNLTMDGYSGNSCNRTSSYSWDFGDGTNSNLETPSCHTYASTGTYNVTLMASNAACGSDSETKKVLVLPPTQPPIVTATPINYCQGQVAVPLTATGTGLLWYTTMTGGIGSSIAPTPSTSFPGSTTYYVSQTITNQCESPRVAITVIVNAAPSAPIVNSPLQLCQNQTAVPLAAAGSSLLWYNSANGGTGSSIAPTPSTAMIGNTNYYVSQTTNGCEGPRALITVMINSFPVAPVVTSPIIYCQSQATLPLTAIGSGLLWYTTSTGGIGTSTAPTPSTTNVGSTKYYVSQSTGCGESPRDSITVNVNASPSATIAYSSSNLCNVVATASTPNPPVLVTLTGATGGNYSISPSTGLPIDAATGTLTPSGSTAGQYTIKYTIPGSGGCPDFVTSATVNVNGSPTAIVSYPAAICTSEAATNVMITGSQGGTFSSSAGLTIDPSTGVITPSSSTPGAYIITYTIAAIAPCPGFTTTTNVTITSAPSATIAYSTSNLCNVTATASTPNPTVPVILTGTTGGSYSISPSIGLTIDAATGTLTPSGSTAGQYTIKYTIPGAGGCPDFVTSATVNVNGSPTAIISYPAAICTSDAATNVMITGSQGGTFSSSTGLTIAPLTGIITPSSSIPGAYIITYTIAATAPCPGFSTTANVTITAAPSATIIYNPSTLCNVINSSSTPNPPIIVTLTGTTGGSYSILPSIGLLIDAATGTLTPSGAMPGTYTITYKIPGAGGCPDYTTTTTINVSGTPMAVISYASPSYCQGINNAQQVVVSGTSGGTFNSTQGLSINATNGEINPSLSTAGTYTVTYTILASPPCPGYIATTNVEIDESPVLTFPVSSKSICSGDTAVFMPSSTVANTQYSWAVTGTLPMGVSGTTSGTSSGTNATIPLSFVNTGTNTQTLNIEVTPTNPSQNPCAGTPYHLTLIVNPFPPAPVVSDTINFCMGAPSSELTAPVLPGNNINWYDENFLLLNAAPTISTSIPIQFIYYVTQSNSYGCESPKSKITAIVHPTPKIISSSYTNPTICGIPSGTIVLNVLDLNNNAIPNIPVIVHYTKFQTAYQIADSTDASGKITVPLVAGTYSDILVEATGCASQKIPDIFVLKDPSPPAQPIAGYNAPLCSEMQLSLTASSATSSLLGPIDYVWVGPAFGSLADTNRSTVVSFPSATVADAGIYIVYAIQNNCISPATSFQVDIKQSPSKPIISTKTPLCIGDNLFLQAFSSIPVSNAVLNYSWAGPGAGFPVNLPDAGINNVKVQDAGIYTITVNSPQTGCSSTSDTLIQIGGYPIVKFPQDSVLTFPTGYLFNLAPVITNASDPNILPIKMYEWTPPDDISCNDSICSSPIATIKNNVCYSVKATNIYGCSGSDTICIKTFCKGSQIMFPNTFTPLGDVPENAKFMVRAIGISSVKSFRIFNRWGQIVFEKDNFPPNSSDFGWDGRVNGKLADAGVYVYTAEVICDNGVSYLKQGNVTLL
jgi:hypothetical protein